MRLFESTITTDSGMLSSSVRISICRFGSMGWCRPRRSTSRTLATNAENAANAHGDMWPNKLITGPNDDKQTTAGLPDGSTEIHVPYPIYDGPQSGLD